MHEAERRLQTMINPLSSAFTRWWCHSAARHILTGYGRGSTRMLRHGREGSRATSVPERAENYGYQRSPRGDMDGLRPGYAQVDLLPETTF